ncbi:unnamed protein product [Hymenolepis diminuta]|uniref:Pan3 C-terminal knob domain-containing protein n=1 Tax=Hymenolepis diminuta TaxID=6216 RepID=A0A564YIG1_HYMDI|nr:unnamed protein product [Hymenolepis diminuta]
MANYFSQGNNSPMIPHNRFNFNPTLSDNLERSDMSSLTMSLANTYLNNPSQYPLNSQRMQISRSSRPFSSTQSLHPSQNYDMNSWLDRNKIMNQSSFNSALMDAKLNDPFAQSRYGSGRPLDEQKNVGIIQRMPLMNDGLGYRDMPVSHSSGPPMASASSGLTGGGDFGGLMPPNQVQSPPTANASQWAMYPPVPPYGSEHLRTGRFYLMRSASPDIDAASYIEQATFRSIKAKIQACLPPTTTDSKFPTQLGPYMSVTPMDNAPRASRSLGFMTQSFRAWCPRLGRYVVLRRVILDSTKAITRDAYVLANAFSEERDSTVLRLLDVLPVTDFSDNSVLFVYDFIPCARSLLDIFMLEHTKNPDQVVKSDFAPERRSWFILVQLTQALRYAHKKMRRSLDVLDPTKVLIQDGSRVYINCYGLKDVVNHPHSNDKQRPEAMAMDFITLGNIMLGTIVGTQLAYEKPAEYLSLLDSGVSPELRTIVRDLVLGNITTIDALVIGTADHAYDCMESVDVLARNLETFLQRESSNGRLLRLICKLNSVVERQDVRTSKYPEPDWSETDDRYMLKLFRDYVFHQVDQNGAPYLDLAHTVQALNKVEAGSTELVCLSSRKAHQVIIVSYADIRDFLDKSFSHLVEESRRSVLEQQQMMQQQQQQTTGRGISQQQRRGDNLAPDLS